MDSETLDFLRHAIGAEHNVPEALRSRLAGGSVAELRADAQALTKQLGIAPERERDAGGKFTGTIADMNVAIRRAAGR